MCRTDALSARKSKVGLLLRVIGDRVLAVLLLLEKFPVHLLFGDDALHDVNDEDLDSVHLVDRHGLCVHVIVLCADADVLDAVTNIDVVARHLARVHAVDVAVRDFFLFHPLDVVEQEVGVVVIDDLILADGNFGTDCVINGWRAISWTPLVLVTLNRACTRNGPRGDESFPCATGFMANRCFLLFSALGVCDQFCNIIQVQ